MGGSCDRGEGPIVYSHPEGREAIARRDGLSSPARLNEPKYDRASQKAGRADAGKQSHLALHLPNHHHVRERNSDVHGLSCWAYDAGVCMAMPVQRALTIWVSI